MSTSSYLVRKIFVGALVATPLLILATSPAKANAVITAVFDSSAGISLADQTTINSALAFYNTNMTSTFSTVIAFGTQAAGGASSIKDVYSGLSYSSYYSGLATNSATTLNPVQISAVATLPNSTNNPVTGSTGVAMTTTLAGLYGLAPQTSETWSQCGNLTATACITIGVSYLGSPSLFGTVQHEVNEVLGTSSNLSSGSGVPANPAPADLYRYSAPGVRGFALNASTDEPCTGSPTAYFSVNGGAANLNNYNNCNNGGDYGDWGGNPGPPQVQDAFGSSSESTSLALASSEVKLLEAVGYNFVSSVPELSEFTMFGLGLAGLAFWRRKTARS